MTKRLVRKPVSAEQAKESLEWLRAHDAEMARHIRTLRLHLEQEEDRVAAEAYREHRERGIKFAPGVEESLSWSVLDEEAQDRIAQAGKAPKYRWIREIPDYWESW